jgi:NADPH:quinone reductase-like Zn-dependent oxidoreductase
MKMMTGRTFPRAMGMDFAGTVLSTGPGVTRFKTGDAVFGLARLKESGAFGEALITNENFLAVKPPEVSFEQAACLPTGGITAWIPSL